MFSFGLFLLASLLLASNALAIKVTYYAKVAGSNAPGAMSNKATEVDDEKGSAILSRMSTWSDDKYKAVNAKVGPARITVSPVTAPKTPAQATEMINEMQSLVVKHYRPRSPSPAPGPPNPSRTDGYGGSFSSHGHGGGFRSAYRRRALEERRDFNVIEQWFSARGVVLEFDDDFSIPDL